MKRNAVGLGGASLVLIFSILCLAIFSVLALSSANREKTLTDRLKASTEAYYAADSRAVEIEVKLREALARGETPSEIDGDQCPSRGRDAVRQRGDPAGHRRDNQLISIKDRCRRITGCSAAVLPYLGLRKPSAPVLPGRDQRPQR